MSVQSQPGYLFQKGVWRDSETGQVLDIDRFWVAGQVGLDHFLLLDAVANHYLLSWIIFSWVMQSSTIFSWVG